MGAIGAKGAQWGNVSAPGIFFDPCPTGGLLGGALRGRISRSYLGVWLY